MRGFGTERRRNRSSALVIELTPMIDVVFLLIIFFMVTAQFARTTRARLDLPLERGEQLEQPDEAGLIINIRRDGTIVVADRERTLDDLASLVGERVRNQANGDPQRAKLMIRADRNAPAQALNAVVTRLESLGVGGARLATQVP